jgi:hypothetical protein
MKPWALDTETFLIYPGYLAPELVCVTWAHGEANDTRSGLIHGRDPGVCSFVSNRLAHEHTVYANAPFDLAVFGAKWPKLIPSIFEALDDGRVHDVQTREKLIDLARGTFRFEEDEDGKVRAKGYSLFDLVMRRLGRKLDKDTWRMRYHDLWDLPCSEWPKGARDYATSDALSTLIVWEAQELQVYANASHQGTYLENAAAQTRAHWALHLMSAWGIRTNQAAVERLEARVTEEIETIREGLVLEGLVRKDGTRDTKRAVRRMVQVMGEDSILTTKGVETLRSMDMRHEEIIAHALNTGTLVSVSEDAAMASGDEVLLNYSRYTRLRNLLTGSVKHLKTGTVTPVQSRFEVLVETGRTSSSGPNIQNLRRAPGVRECFVPRPGCLIAACDYAAAELHTLAQVCYDLFGKSALRDALNSGTDVHLWVGAQLMGVRYDDAVEFLAAGDGVTKDMRQLAKAANFGFPGGCSPKRFMGIAHAYGVPVDLKEAARLRALWFKTWPEMRLFFDHVSECADGNGFYYVKQPRVPRLRSRCTWTSACNSHFQGLAADGAKAALYAVTREQFLNKDSPLYNTRCLAFVHDEILIEAPEEQAHDAAMRLREVMEKEFNQFVPDCPTTAEPTLMRYWSKKAEQTWHEDRLVPWKESA